MIDVAGEKVQTGAKVMDEAILQPPPPSSGRVDEAADPAAFLAKDAEP